MKLGKIAICMLALCTFCAVTGCDSGDDGPTGQDSKAASEDDGAAGASAGVKGGGAGNAQAGQNDADMGSTGAGSEMDSTGAGSDADPDMPLAGDDGTGMAGEMDSELDPPENAPPMVTLLTSPEVDVLTGTPLMLEASAMDDGLPEPASLTVEWVVSEGAGTPTFGDKNALGTSVSFDEAGDYTLQLNVSDGELEASVLVFVHVMSADRPLNIAILTDNIDAADHSAGVDDALIALLTDDGHTVSRFNPMAPPSEVGEQDLVLFSSGMDSSAVDPQWASTPIPVLVWEFYALGQLGMSDSVAGGMVHDFNGGNVINVTGTGPLAAGFSGNVQVSETGTGTLVAPPTLAPTAKIIATLGGDGMHAGRPVYFAFETGDIMFGGQVAPARRVAVPLGLNQARSLTPEGIKIIRAAILWAVNGAVAGMPDGMVEPGEGETLKVMPIGDSITRGTGGNNSYRQFLAEMLDEAGCKYDFVGSLRNNDKGTPTVMFDWDHEGHGGWTTSDMLNAIDGFAMAAQPDIVLIHLGTNDVLKGLSPADAQANLSALIQSLRDINPSLKIVLAQIIAGSAVRMVDDDMVSLVTGVPPMNSAIAAVAQSEDNGASPIRLVDMFSGYDDAAMNFDGIHPTPTGEEFMASRWFDELRPLLSCSP